MLTGEQVDKALLAIAQSRRDGIIPEHLFEWLKLIDLSPALATTIVSLARENNPIYAIICALEFGYQLYAVEQLEELASK